MWIRFVSRQVERGWGNTNFYILRTMNNLSAYRPRHWLLLVAGLSFLFNIVVLFISYSMPLGVEMWPTMLISVAVVLLWLVMGVSLIVYCVQWVVTMFLSIMAHNGSAST